jgi:hypothetical protein
MIFEVNCGVEPRTARPGVRYKDGNVSGGSITLFRVVKWLSSQGRLVSVTSRPTGLACSFKS